LSGKKIATVLIALVVLGGGVAIVGSSMSSGVFNLTLADALARPERLVGQEFKVGGNVAAGSVVRSPDGFEVAFTIEDAESRRLKCHYKGAVPDPFAEGREVILQGTLDAANVMQVSKITVKCPSKYQEAGVTEEEAADYYQTKYKQHKGDGAQ
jgi:cytochrome c-type biogenesis protein CcmE